MSGQRRNRVSGGAKAPSRAAGTPAVQSEQHARRADYVREQALGDSQTLSLLEQAHRLREGQECEWITFDDLDKQYPAEA
jgi:hypothetical protein